MRASSIVGTGLSVCCALLVALAALGIGPPRRAAAATFTVTKTADTNDGTCNADCSLREAISAANAAGADTITLPAGTYTLTIPGAPEDANATGDLDVTQDLTITGAGPGTTVIDGGGLDNVIEALGTAGLTINSVTVRNGSGAGVDAEQGNVNLTHVVVTNNGDVGVGSSSGNITLTDVTISDNHNNDGINTSSGDLVIDTTSITGNDGGINTLSGNIDLAHSTIDGNSSDGINTSSGDLTLDSSTISNNDGDGVNTSSGNVTAVNSTISANAGDGIGTSNGTIDLTNVTVDHNSDGDGVFTRGSAHMVNTIVADNDLDCSLSGPPTGDHNLDSDGTCHLGGAGDVSNTDPMLGALAANGGPTKTRALLAGSPAIDAGTNAGCPATDQRGVSRPANGTCDIGAFEVNGEAAAPTPTHTATATATACGDSCPTQPAVAHVATSTPTSTATRPPAAIVTAAKTPAPVSTVAGVVRAPNTVAAPARLPSTGQGAGSGDVLTAFASLIVGTALAGVALLGAGIARRRV